MHYKIFENVIDKKLINDIFTFYNNSETYTTNGMHKVEQPWTLEVVRNLEPILSNYFDTSLENIGDNIYKHDFPYFPHVDISKAGYPCFNVLIPIKVENDIEQKFCGLLNSQTTESKRKYYLLDHYRLFFLIVLLYFHIYFLPR